MSSNRSSKPTGQDKKSSFRRCHLCGHLNEEDHGQTIIRCHCCKRSLAPFYYFNDRDIPELSENSLRMTDPQNGYLPIQGLTAYW